MRFGKTGHLRVLIKSLSMKNGLGRLWVKKLDGWETKSRAKMETLLFSQTFLQLAGFWILDPVKSLTIHFLKESSSLKRRKEVFSFPKDTFPSTPNRWNPTLQSRRSKLSNTMPFFQRKLFTWSLLATIQCFLHWKIQLNGRVLTFTEPFETKRKWMASEDATWVTRSLRSNFGHGEASSMKSTNGRLPSTSTIWGFSRRIIWVWVSQPLVEEVRMPLLSIIIPPIRLAQR